MINVPLNAFSGTNFKFKDIKCVQRSHKCIKWYFKGKIYLVNYETHDENVEKKYLHCLPNCSTHVWWCWNVVEWVTLIDKAKWKISKRASRCCWPAFVFPGKLNAKIFSPLSSRLCFSFVNNNNNPRQGQSYTCNKYIGKFPKCILFRALCKVSLRSSMTFTQRSYEKPHKA